jgi:two-component system catabolic regulation response regulator CreB
MKTCIEKAAPLGSAPHVGHGCPAGEVMKKRILVVEDEPSILENVLYSLETEGFEPSGCPTGEEALRLFATESFDLVVLDIGLPDTSGFELCKELRSRSTVPVIFLTARSGEIDRIVGLEIGADDYVVKPFSPRELSARVRAVLRRCSPPESGDEGTGAAAADPDAGVPFRIDGERLQIKYYGEVLPLSSTEFRVLREICEHPGRVYSRGQLMDVAWDEPDAAMERTVDAHIKSLRAKLRAVREDVDPIATHRGLGYSMREDW